MKLPPTDTHFKPTDWDTYQLHQYTYAVEHCTNRRTALDCGAHVGIMTHRMARDFYTTHAFEPQWGDYLEQNMQNQQGVYYLHRVALGAQEGTCDMQVNPTNTGGTHTTQGTTTRVKTIDSYGFRGVDLIKMDLEGSELDALQGAEHTINTFKPVLLIELERVSTQRHEVERLLGDYGYAQIFRKNADTVWTHKG